VSTVRITEIAELVGVTHQRTSVIVRQPGFPAPAGREDQSRLWDRHEVVAWAGTWRKEKPAMNGGVPRVALAVGDEQSDQAQRGVPHDPARDNEGIA
jgi:hypothetical protein